jgi:hypothetical protein
MTHPALSVSDTVLEAYSAGAHNYFLSITDSDDLDVRDEKRAALAAAIAQWVRETIQGKSDAELLQLSLDVAIQDNHFGNHDLDPKARAALLTFLGVQP